MSSLKTIKSLAQVIGTSILLVSCGIHETKGSATLAPQDSTLLILKKPVGYAEVSRYVISESCVKCHNSQTPKGDVNLDNYDSIQENLDEVKTEILTKQMPPPRATALTEFQLQIVQKWFDAGTPEQTPDADASPAPTPVPSITPVPTPADAVAINLIRKNFETFVYPLVKNSCMGCHDSNARPHGLANLPIVRKKVWKDIREATHVLDFSKNFPNWSALSDDPLYYLSQIKGVIVSNSMPPKDYKFFHHLDGRLLRPSEKEIIVNWANQSMDLLNQVNPPPTAQKYLSNRCLGCHNAATHSGDIVFQKSGDQIIVPKDQTIDGIKLVTPFDPENSALYLVLLHDDSGRHGLAQMPDGDEAKESDQKLIYDWIKAGAP